MLINDYCLFATKAIDQLVDAFHAEEWEMTWPEFVEKARVEFNRELNKIKEAPEILEWDMEVHEELYKGTRIL